MRLRLAVASLLLSALLASVPVARGDGAPDLMAMRVLGFVEYAQIIGPPSHRMKAKLDTGAKTSSLNALNQERFRRDGERWIAFDVTVAEGDDAPIRYERPIERFVRIVQHDGSHQRRPVVRMRICLADIAHEGEVSLIDRTEFTYPLLVGRNLLAERILVDASDSLTTDPDCAIDDSGGTPGAGKAESGNAKNQDKERDDADDAAVDGANGGA